MSNTSQKNIDVLKRTIEMLEHEIDELKAERQDLYFNCPHIDRDRALDDVLRDDTQMVMLLDPHNDQYCLVEQKSPDRTPLDIGRVYDIALDFAHSDNGRSILKNVITTRTGYPANPSIHDSLRKGLPMFTRTSDAYRINMKPIEFALFWYGFTLRRLDDVTIHLRTTARDMLQMTRDIRIDTIPMMLFDKDGATVRTFDNTLTDQEIIDMMLRQNRNDPNRVTRPPAHDSKTKFIKTRQLEMWSRQRTVGRHSDMPGKRDIDTDTSCYVPSAIAEAMHNVLGTKSSRYEPYGQSEEKIRQAHAIWNAYGMPSTKMVLMPNMTMVDALMLHEVLTKDDEYVTTIRRKWPERRDGILIDMCITGYKPWPDDIIDRYDIKFEAWIDRLFNTDDLEIDANRANKPAFDEISELWFERVEMAMKMRNVTREQLSTLVRGMTVASNGAKRGDKTEREQTPASIPNMLAISMILEFDIRALMGLPPYDNDDDRKDLTDALLTPTLQGYWLPRDAVVDGNMPWKTRLYEIFQYSNRLSMVLIRKDSFGPVEIEQSDIRVAVNGDAHDAFLFAQQLLAESPKYLESIRYSGNPKRIKLLEPDNSITRDVNLG